MKTNKLIVGNWKMHKTPFEAGILALEILAKTKAIKDIEIVVCPSFVCLDRVSKAIKGSNIFLGAQNLHHEKGGAFTGEVSSVMLKDLGTKYVLIGHSERRQYFNEDDELVNKKAIAAIESGIIPIICVGETKEQRDNGQEYDVIKAQVKAGIAGLEKGSFIIAYEPVWAIGTGLVATANQADEACELVKSIAGKNTKVLYGGSMNGANVKELLSKDNIDGGLIGGASLKAEEFVRIIEIGAKG
ncbi:MAG: triose-phosphate isomerase [Firmicutes bacterium]|nr:triose-phosphate isomerase [Bacillota bacterium]